MLRPSQKFVLEYLITNTDSQIPELSPVIHLPKRLDANEIAYRKETSRKYIEFKFH